MVITPIYYSARSFNEGLAAVNNDSKWGFINKKGKFICPIKYARIHDFLNDIALVCTDIAIPDKCTNACLINKSGDEIYCTDPPFTSIFDTGNDSFKSLEKKYPIKVEKVTYYKKYFNNLYDFKDGLAIISNKFEHSLENKELKYGYINQNGNIVIPCQFNSARSFSYGLAAVQDATGKWGFINKKGNFIVKPIFSFAASPNENLASVGLNNQDSGFVNTTCLLNKLK